MRPLDGGAPAGVVLDCDGLLLETESRWTMAEQAVLARRGAPWTADLKERMLGTSLPVAARLMAAHAGAPDDHEAIAAEVDAELAAAIAEHGVEPMPGAADLVAALAGRVPLAVASNSAVAHVRAALAASGLPDVFAAVVCAGGPLRPKPQPDVYLAACAALELPPARCVAFEDSQPGVDAARAAGLVTVGVPSLPDQRLAADVVLGSLLDAPALLGVAA